MGSLKERAIKASEEAEEQRREARINCSKSQAPQVLAEMLGLSEKDIIYDEKLTEEISTWTVRPAFRVDDLLIWHTGWLDPDHYKLILLCPNCGKYYPEHRDYFISLEALGKELSKHPNYPQSRYPCEDCKRAEKMRIANYKPTFLEVLSPKWASGRS